MIQILRRKQVAEKIGSSQMSLWRWVKAGTFPAPIQLGPNSVGFLEDEVDAWIAQRRAARENAGSSNDAQDQSGAA